MGEIRKLATLRRLKPSEMTDAELEHWINLCWRVEAIGGLPAKARRAWKASREAAQVEQWARSHQ